MALPYPEGEVYFKRAALKLADGDFNFDPDDLKSFNTHCLIEWVWNEPKGDSAHTYSRNATKADTDGDGDNKAYWECLNVMFDTGVNGRMKFKTPVQRLVRLMAPSRGNNEYKKRAAGGPPKVVLTPVELFSDLPYMFIDLVFPVRNIYFPLAQKASADYPGLCTYLMVDFRLRKGVTMGWDIDYKKDGKPYTREIPFDNQLGLGARDTETLAVNIKGVYNYLMLPRQFRSADKGLYTATNPDDINIRMLSKYDTDTSAYGGFPLKTDGSERWAEFAFSDKLDYAQIINDDFGVDLAYRPFEIPVEETKSLITTGITIGLGFIPVVGPIASTSFVLFLAICNDPEGFKEQDPLKLGANILGAIVDSAIEARSNMPMPKNASGGSKTAGAILDVAKFVSNTVAKGAT